MSTVAVDDLTAISASDQAELNRLLAAIALNSNALALFAIAPDCSPHHPVVQQFTAQLQQQDPALSIRTLAYSSTNLFTFLHQLKTEPLETEPLETEQLETDAPPADTGRQVVLAFGLEQLPLPSLLRELEQLNLGRETIFDLRLVLVFWFNQEDFLDQFRRHAPDFWDWRSKVARFTTRPTQHPLLYPYLESVVAENSRLRVGGVMQVNRQVDIFLDAIYVSLQAEWRQAERSASLEKAMARPLSSSKFRRSRPGGLSQADEWELVPRDEGPDGSLEQWQPDPGQQKRVNQKTIKQTVDLAEAVRQHRYCIVLGDPGAGKTTLLRYLALHFAQAQQQGQTRVQGGEAEDLGEARLPLLLRIADYAEHLQQAPDRLSDWLGQVYRRWQESLAGTATGEIETLLLQALEQGRCLLLLDGLDEVFDAASRQQVVQRIEQFVSQYAGNQFVVTSRIAGYDGARLGERFQEFTLLPMADEQIDRFLQRWCLAVETAQRPEASPERQQREAQQEASSLLRAIKGNPGVRRFATNPLLLTILALIHRNGTSLPQRRVELYALATKTLIEDWQFGRNLPYGSSKGQLQLVEEEVVALLAPLAFRMHEEKASGLVTETEAEDWLSPRMAELQGVELAEARQLVQQFLYQVRQTTGLFVERAPGLYGFMHLTFEEYFAARQIADNEVDEILRVVGELRDRDRWAEPILLALGYLSRDANRLNRLLAQLFQPLDDYQPAIQNQTLRLKNATSRQPTLVWTATTTPDAPPQESPLLWQDLLLVGQILGEVNVNPRFRKQQIDKLVRTYLGLDTDYDEKPTQQLLQRLRAIEAFNQRGEVLAALHQAADDASLSEDQHQRSRSALLYVACSQPIETAISCLNEILERLTPSLYINLRNLIAALSEEMKPTLERLGAESYSETADRQALYLFAALFYMLNQQYEQAIDQWQSFIQTTPHLSLYVSWAIANCYQAQKKYNLALDCYQQCSEELSSQPPVTNWFVFWRDWGGCYRVDKQYQQSLDCFQQALAIAKQFDRPQDEASVLRSMGESYENWSQYAQAIDYYQQSRNLYDQLEREKEVANLWTWIADCYRQWGKYEQAIKSAQENLSIRHNLEDRYEIANAFFWLGYIYQSWGKYDRAIDAYQQSRDLYDQLEQDKDVAHLWHWLADYYQAWGKYDQAVDAYQQSRKLYAQLEQDKDVANQWYYLADCYRQWGKYEEAIQAEQADLAIRQQLEDRPRIALAYYQFGRIYQAWGKYAQAIDAYQQSRNLYAQLERGQNVADLWYGLADCYRQWGKYEEAIQAEQADLAIRQKLEDRPNTADAYYQFGRIYQAWGNYEQAIDAYQQSRELYAQLEQDKDVADLWYRLAICHRRWGQYEQAIQAEQADLAIRQQLEDRPNIADACTQLGRIYRDWGQYNQAIDYFQQSHDLYCQLDCQEDVARQLRFLANCQRRLARQTGDREAALATLAAAEQRLQAALQLDRAGEYGANLAYDQLALALLYAERLRRLAADEGTVPELKRQFEASWQAGLADLTTLGQVVDREEETLAVARVYLEVGVLEDLERAAALAEEALAVLRQYNRRKLQAAALRLLGEIEGRRALQEQRALQERRATRAAAQWLGESLALYRALALEREVQEVAALLQSVAPDEERS